MEEEGEKSPPKKHKNAPTITFNRESEFYQCAAEANNLSSSRRYGIGGKYTLHAGSLSFPAGGDMEVLIFHRPACGDVKELTLNLPARCLFPLADALLQLADDSDVHRSGGSGEESQAL